MEPRVWVFSILVKRRGASESKSEISKGSGLSQDSHHGTYSSPTVSGFFRFKIKPIIAMVLRIYPVSLKCSSSVSVSGK